MLISAKAVRRGESGPGSAYVDVGTLYGYREAIRLLSGSEQRSELQEFKA